MNVTFSQNNLPLVFSGVRVTRLLVYEYVL